MARTKPKPQANEAAQAPPSSEVLTLAEAAAYLRVPEADVLRATNTQGLPARRVGDEWRFLKASIQDWLGTPLKLPSKEAMMSVVGSWKDDPTLDDLLKEIYKNRGRPMTEEGE
jgi:excisionase family DNA binding protein